MSEWRKVALGDVLTLQRGFDLPARDRVDGPVPIVSSSGVTGWHSVPKVEPPGVVIGRYGSLGSVHWVTEPYWPLNTTLWVKDFRGNDPRYINYLLRTVEADGGAAAAVPGINRNHLHRLPVCIPTVTSQLRIAAVLAAFDELIGTNIQRIEDLEELVRRLYRASFVQFRTRPRIDDDTTSITVGAIPPGWETRTLGDIAEVIAHGISPQEVDEHTPYVGLEHLPRRSNTLREWGRPDTVTSRKFTFVRGDTIFGKIRPYFHKVVWAPFAGVASSDAIIFRASGNRLLPALVNAVASSDALVADAVASSNGTKMPRANPEVLLNFPVTLPQPDDPLLDEFERIAGSALELAANLARQSHGLAATRDLLLPRLVAGRVDISDLDLNDFMALVSA